MKLQLALITAVLAVSTTVAQAADTRTPDILGSVSGESVQTLSKADASKVRGEYHVYYYGHDIGLTRRYFKPRNRGGLTYVEANGYDRPWWNPYTVSR